MSVKLIPLPYDVDALEPFISSTSLALHYDSHYTNYVNALNDLIEGTIYSNLSLEGIIIKSSIETKSEKTKKIFNYSSQIWSHTFFWSNMSGVHNQSPSKVLTRKLIENFGSVDQFKSQFNHKAIELFGSGWTWLVKNKHSDLEIINFGNAQNPLLDGYSPLLVCDLWEHSYYLDYKNDRSAFLDRFWKLVNWYYIDSLNEEIVESYSSYSKSSLYSEFLFEQDWRNI